MGCVPHARNSSQTSPPYDALRTSPSVFSNDSYPYPLPAPVAWSTIREHTTSVYGFPPLSRTSPPRNHFHGKLHSSTESLNSPVPMARPLLYPSAAPVMDRAWDDGVNLDVPLSSPLITEEALHSYSSPSRIYRTSSAGRERPSPELFHCSPTSASDAQEFGCTSCPESYSPEERDTTFERDDNLNGNPAWYGENNWESDPVSQSFSRWNSHHPPSPP